MSEPILLLTYQPKPKRLSLRQKAYRKNRILGMNQYNAARAAGYSHSTALHRSFTLERKIVNDSKFEDAMEQAGITDKYLADHAKKGLENRSGMVQHCYFVTVNKLKGRLKDNNLKELGEALKPVINIINYGTKPNTDSSGSVPTEQVRVRDFAAPSQVQEHQLAPARTQDNVGTQQSNP